MNRPLQLVLLALALNIAACSGDAASRGRPCVTDRDCLGGLCQAGVCMSTSVGARGVDGGADEGPDFNPGDVQVQDTTADVLDDTAPDGGDDTAPDRPPENACGGTVVLDRTIGAPCGPCDDGEWACDGLDAVQCDGASAQNICGGCGDLPGLPGAPCDLCEGGQWACAAGDLACECDEPEPDGSCERPFPIAVGQSLTFSTCGQGDDEDPVRGEVDCRDVNVRGEERVQRLSLDETANVRIRMRDDDPSQAIDTVVYVRSDCGNDASQLLCSDDVPCAQSEIEGGCVNGVQVRESFVDLELEAGVYYVIADTFTYASSAGAFSCGDVLVEVEAIDADGE